jgi:hypothetical protein
MYINITNLIEMDCFDLSHSAAEGGQDAGRNTWDASKAAAAEMRPPLLDTEEKLEAMRDFAKSSGGWTEEEIGEWSADGLNALFLQWIAGDVRQCPAILEGVEFEEREEETLEGDSRSKVWYFQTPKDKGEDMESGPFDSRHEAYKAASDELVGMHQTSRADSLVEIDWQEYEQQASAGRIPSSLSKGDDGEICFYLGS